MKIRVGLIGQGDAWQTRHGPALRVLHDRFDVRAVFNTVSKLAENVATEFQADAVDGYRALVTRCDIDAVLILRKTWLDWLPILAACEAGKAIYWADDLDVDVKTDQWVREAIEQSGVSFMAEFPRRFAPATLRLKELIATRLGPPKMMFCHRRLPEHDAAPNALGKSATRCEMLELIDWCRYVVGRRASSVSSVSHPIGPPTPAAPGNGRTATPPNLVSAGAASSGGTHASNYRCLSLAFDGQEGAPPVTAQLSCGSYIPATWQEAIGFRSPAAMQVVCERGIAFVDLPSNLVWFDEAGRNIETLDTELPVGQQLMSHFHRGVTSLLRNVRDLEDVFSAATVLEAADQSEQNRSWVSIEPA